jgi:predicted transposase YdaD
MAFSKDGCRDCRREGRKGGREGRQEGRQEGERLLLQKQLERRFGVLPLWVSERLAQATPEQLEAWALDLLDAADLGDLFPTG